MAKRELLISPKQAAKALGVSESSLKRWCDQGLIHTSRTAGGHRKITASEVLRYTREHNLPVVSRELLGLPSAGKHAAKDYDLAMGRFADALLQDNELLARQIVIDLYVANHSLSSIFDEVIFRAFDQIGDRWACNAAEVYQERRSCEITLKILFELRSVLPIPDAKWSAMGATIEGDLYSLGTNMAELVLRDTGFDARNLGTSIPMSSLKKAVETHRPRLFWLSVSHLQDPGLFLQEFDTLSKACMQTSSALVVGGRALSETLRREMRYSAYCDNMQHLETFARTLHGARGSRKGAKPGSP